MLVGFESVSKYLEHRATFVLKTGFGSCLVKAIAVSQCRKM